MPAKRKKRNWFESKQTHKFHISNMIQAKSSLPKNPPYKPAFLENKDFGSYKRFHEEVVKFRQNVVIFKRLRHINTKKSAYHPEKIITKPCPAFSTTFANRYFKEKTKKKENFSLGKRIESAKPSLSAQEQKRNFKQQQKYKSQISKSTSKSLKRSINPYF